jgi:hypothetical protein
MSHRAAAWLAWSLWVLAVLLVPGATLEFALGWVGAGDIPYAIGFVALQLGAATAGAVISSRLPGNAVGWIFLAIGILMGLLLAVDAYAELGIEARSGPLPGTTVAAWVGTWVFVPAAFGLPMFLLLLFPDGRFVSKRWQLAGWVLGAIVTLAAASQAFRPGRIPPGIENPLAPGGPLGEAFVYLSSATEFLALPGFALAVAGLAVGLRRSRGVERQQLKWFTFSSALVGAGFTSAILLPGGLAADLAFLVGLTALALLPIAAGVAILRHGLYDIDVLINRTLVYGSLTGSLALVYFGGVTATQAIFQRVTGQERLPQVVIVASTLVIAALFNPVRRRIQMFIDTRFYRRKYDAAKTLESFSARLRDETDLEALSDDMIEVVRETIQPEYLSLWLRPPVDRRVTE